MPNTKGEYFTQPKMADYGPAPRRGTNIDRARAALELIADDFDDTCGRWFVIARYTNGTSAHSAASTLRKRADQVPFELPDDAWWEFGANGSEVLARIAVVDMDED